MKNSKKTTADWLLIVFYLNIILATIVCYIELDCQTMTTTAFFLIPITFSAAQIAKIRSRMAPKQAPKESVERRPGIEKRVLEWLEKEFEE